ncbi:unnamed protein product, partial [marine sediment metagenome]
SLWTDCRLIDPCSSALESRRREAKGKSEWETALLKDMGSASRAGGLPSLGTPPRQDPACSPPGLPGLVDAPTITNGV